MDNDTKTVIGFGAVDTKGRELGCQVRIAFMEQSWDVATNKMVVDPRWIVAIRPTRGGLPFGACTAGPRTERFDSQEAAQAAAPALVEAYRAKYTKTAKR